MNSGYHERQVRIFQMAAATAPTRRDARAFLELARHHELTLQRGAQRERGLARI